MGLDGLFFGLFSQNEDKGVSGLGAITLLNICIKDRKAVEGTSAVLREKLV